MQNIEIKQSCKDCNGHGFITYESWICDECRGKGYVYITIPNQEDYDKLEKKYQKLITSVAILIGYIKDEKNLDKDDIILKIYDLFPDLERE
jgi:RecJ-like exonuclease